MANVEHARNGSGAQLRTTAPPKVAEALEVDAKRLPNPNRNKLLAGSCSALSGGDSQQRCRFLVSQPGNIDKESVTAYHSDA